MAKPEIHLIAAQTRNRVIGRHNSMPWHLPRDLAHFKRSTLNHPVIMGRKTYQTLGKALPKRENHVISRNPALHLSDARTHPSLEHALSACQDSGTVFILGGGALYHAAMPLADELNITWIEAELPGDTYFPPIDPSVWQMFSEESAPADADNAYDLRFCRYRRRAE